jgi:phage terminase small subunit
MKFARELAAGNKPREAAIAAGYPPGSCFDGNARKRAGRYDVKRMVAELKAPIADEMEITLKWAIAEHRELYRTAKAAGQIRDAREGLKELTILAGIRIERSEHGEPGEFERKPSARARLVKSFHTSSSLMRLNGAEPAPSPRRGGRPQAAVVMAM